MKQQIINDQIDEQNGKIESTNGSLNASINLSTKESTISSTGDKKINQKIVNQKDGQLTKEIFNEPQTKENGVDQVVSKLKSTKLKVIEQILVILVLNQIFFCSSLNFTIEQYSHLQ